MPKQLGDPTTFVNVLKRQPRFHQALADAIIAIPEETVTPSAQAAFSKLKKDVATDPTVMRAMLDFIICATKCKIKGADVNSIMAWTPRPMPLGYVLDHDGNLVPNPRTKHTLPLATNDPITTMLVPGHDPSHTDAVVRYLARAEHVHTALNSSQVKRHS